jgi:hypothetical protein
MSRVAILAKMSKTMATTQLTTIELVMKPPQCSILTADCGRPCSGSVANTAPAGDNIANHKQRWSVVLIDQYFSFTNRRPSSDFWSSYPCFIERFTISTFSCFTFVASSQECGRDNSAARALVVGTQDVPWRFFGISGLNIKSRARGKSNQRCAKQIHRAELPLAERIFDARFEAALLLFFTGLEPDFDEFWRRWSRFAFRRWGRPRGIDHVVPSCRSPERTPLRGCTNSGQKLRLRLWPKC